MNGIHLLFIKAHNKLLSLYQIEKRTSGFNESHVIKLKFFLSLVQKPTNVWHLIKFNPVSEILALGIFYKEVCTSTQSPFFL